VLNPARTRRAYSSNGTGIESIVVFTTSCRFSALQTLIPANFYEPIPLSVLPHHRQGINNPPAKLRITHEAHNTT
jgi:hypothetical protein